MTETKTQKDGKCKISCAAGGDVGDAVSQKSSRESRIDAGRSLLLLPPLLWSPARLAVALSVPPPPPFLLLTNRIDCGIELLKKRTCTATNPSRGGPEQVSIHSQANLEGPATKGWC